MLFHAIWWYQRKQASMKTAEQALSGNDMMTGTSAGPGVTQRVVSPVPGDRMTVTGQPGIVLALPEAQRHFGDDLYGDAATRDTASTTGTCQARP